MNMNLSEYMLWWCEKHYPEYAESLYDDMVDVAAGNREGSKSEKDMVKKIIVAYKKLKQTDYQMTDKQVNENFRV